jgi:DNA polymerase-3 subunit gamma/tau
VIEIDAASNTGVDNIRELIERAQFAPVQCRYKVYVIDECHMLSVAAFNALLKTLEEPPERVVFVLATTDPQRVLPTIISRCQRFDFRRIPLEAMVQHLQHIAQTEHIDITADAVRLVAQVSQGGLRDAESLLDQMSLSTEQVTVERVWDLVGAVPERNLLALMRAIAADQAIPVLEQTRQLMDRGREPLIVLQNLASFYRDVLIAKTARDRNDLVAITSSTWAELVEFVQVLDVPFILAGQEHLRKAEMQVKQTTQPRLWLEVTLLGLLPSAIAAQSAVPPSAIEPTNRSAQTAPPRPPATSAPPFQSAAPTTRADSPAQKAPSPQAEISPTKPSPAGLSPAETPQTKPSPAETAQPAPVGNGKDHHVADHRTNHPTPPAANSTATADSSAIAHSAPPAARSESVSPPASPPTANFGTQSNPAAQSLPSSAEPNRTPVESQAGEQGEAAAVSQNADLWQQVVEQLNPLTKALLNDYGKLLSCRDRQANVEVSTSQLLKIAQKRISDIEAAFAQVLNRPIKVKLSIATDTPDIIPAEINAAQSRPTAPDTTATGTGTGTGTGAIAPTPAPASDFSDPPSDPSAANLASHPVAPPPPVNPVSPHSDVPPKAPVPAAASETDNTYSSSQPTAPASDHKPLMMHSYSEDMLTRASRSFAQFFNGQMIELDDEDVALWSPAAQAIQAQSQPANSVQADQQSPHQQTPDQKTPDQKTPDQQTSDQQSPDQPVPDSNQPPSQPSPSQPLPAQPFNGQSYPQPLAASAAGQNSATRSATAMPYEDEELDDDVPF